MIGSGALEAKKLEEMTRKASILGAFAGEEEVAEE